MAVLELLLGVGGGVFAGYGIHVVIQRMRRNSARETAGGILQQAYKDAETVLKEAELQAKQDAYLRQLQLDEEIRTRRSEMQLLEHRLLDKEEHLAQRQSSLDRLEREHDNLVKKHHARERMVKAQEERLAELENQLRARLETMGKLSVEEARRQLMAQIALETRHDAAQVARRIEKEMQETLAQRARRTLAAAIERCAADLVNEGTVAVVSLPSEEMKGRIIGKEGRNIRAFEVLTGVDLIIDDTPEAILISSFDPMRRDIARRALQALVEDGRIHPSRIEQMVAKAQEEVQEEAYASAKEIAESLGVVDTPEEILEALARLKYRTSYGQNVLQHSKDVALIAGSLAAEIGENSMHARRAGLFHDLGKGTEHFTEGNHVDVGLSVLRKYGESPDVLHAIEAHHEGVEAQSVLAVLLQIADRVSAARPGARRDSLDAYVSRMRHLEEIAAAFPGVERAFAIHAGREIRVIVEATKIDDDGAFLLAKDIARKVQAEVQFGGPIQVTVIRETRAIAFTRPSHSLAE